MSNGITAKLVYDGGDEVHIPSEMGTPREDQMQGTPAERLVELAGRVCYDSLGKGRPSFTVTRRRGNSSGELPPETIEGYHDHILSVGHLSVLEHANFTVQANLDNHWRLMLPLFNRPGLILYRDTDQGIRMTVNLRTVLDWDRFPMFSSDDRCEWACRGWKILLAREANEIAPHIVPPPTEDDLRFVQAAVPIWSMNRVEPCGYDEIWISMFLSCSRGCSHELVRHGDFTAISQRSTRYVDEDNSPWIDHPLWREYLGDVKKGYKAVFHPWDGDDPEDLAFRVMCASKHFYSHSAPRLQMWLESRGVDKSTARKQARGAARGYLGNALQTELIFSANVAQWKRMLRQRATVHADAEIRELFCKVLAELKRSRWEECFEKWQLTDSPDGIGQVAVEIE